MRKSKLLALLLAVAMLAVMIAACAPAADAPAEAPPPAETPEAPADTADPADPVEEVPLPVADEMVFRMQVTSFDGNFSPILAQTVYDMYIVSLVFDSLITNDAEGNPIPWLATHWESSDDNLVYTLFLDERATFSDGSPVTTADVAFSLYDSIAHPDYAGPRGYRITNIESYEIIDTHTIAFTFYEASPTNIWDIGHAVMPVDFYGFTDWDDFLDLQQTPLGSGRFVFEEWRPMEFLRLSANTNHWHPDRVPNVDTILLIDIPEEVVIDALIRDEVDLAQPSTLIDNYNMLMDAEGVTPVVFIGNGYQFMKFNTTQPQLNDVRVRQALMYALDRQAYIDSALGPALGRVGTAPVSPAGWAYPDGGALNLYSFNLDRARQLMSEAGWEPGADGVLVNADGVRMELNWPVYTEVPWPSIMAELAADSWAQIGVDLTIELFDFNTVGEIGWSFDEGLPVAERDFSVFVMGWSLAVDPDPTGGLDDGDAYDGWNASGFSNPEAQELIARGRVEFDRAARAEIYAEWAVLMNYWLPTAVIAYRNELWGMRSNVSGLDISAFRDWTYDAHLIVVN